MQTKDEPLQTDQQRADKVKVFISYSRADTKFADELVDGLNFDGGFEVTIDRHSIRHGEKWKPRLSALIEGADAVVFVLSPDSVTSEICQWEVDEADLLKKRLVSVLHRPLNGIAVPEKLDEINWVDFTGQGTLMAGIQALAKLLKEDLEWLKESTRLLNLALDWERAGRSNNRLLFGKDIIDAKKWIAERPKGEKITESHRDFIKTSELEEEIRKDEEHQRLAELARASEKAAIASRQVARRTMAGLLTSVVLAVVASGLGLKTYEALELAKSNALSLERERQRADEQTRRARQMEMRASTCP